MCNNLARKYRDLVLYKGLLFRYMRDNLYIIFAVLVMFLFLFLSNFTIGEPQKISGQILNISSIQNYGPVSHHAAIKTSGGRMFKMELPSGGNFKKEMKILILKEKRFFLSPKYTFLTKINE